MRRKGILRCFGGQYWNRISHNKVLQGAGKAIFHDRNQGLKLRKLREGEFILFSWMFITISLLPLSLCLCLSLLFCKRPSGFSPVKFAYSDFQMNVIVFQTFVSFINCLKYDVQRILVEFLSNTNANTCSSICCFPLICVLSAGIDVSCNIYGTHHSKRTHTSIYQWK